MQRSEVLALAVENEVAEMGRVRSLVMTFCGRHGLESEVVDKVIFVLEELFTNVVSYGYDGAGGHSVEITLALGDGQLLITMEDDARAFDPVTFAEPELDGPIEERSIGGLGIHLVRSLMDRMEYSRLESGRNRVTMALRHGTIIY